MSTREMDSDIAYAPNIRLNPRRFFGTWTPEGWRTHLIRTARTEVEKLEFSGDGSRIDFAGGPMESPGPLHDPDDATGDGGIYPSVARVEHPPGRARWAVSHTFLAFPVADQTLYEQEYTWEEGCLQTHFRRHVLAEEGVTDGRDGLTCAIRNRPISTVIAGNKVYPLCNSAVRGVWDNPEKKGKNYYSRQLVKRCSSHNAVYILVKENPVLQCEGIWKLTAADESAFSPDGYCSKKGLLIGNGIPLDCPKLGLTGYVLHRVPSEFYGGTVEVASEGKITINESMLADLRSCRDVAFRPDAVGFAAWGCWDHMKHIKGMPGYYCFAWDFNDNAIVDAEDEETLRKNLGREVRVNYYSAGYFGNDWLSSGVLLNPEMHGGESVVCAWTQGAGYDAASGVVHLFDTPGPGRKVYVEYHFDEPAEPGRDNIRVSLRRDCAVFRQPRVVAGATHAASGGRKSRQSPCRLDARTPDGRHADT